MQAGIDICDPVTRGTLEDGVIFLHLIEQLVGLPVLIAETPDMWVVSSHGDRHGGRRIRCHDGRR